MKSHLIIATLLVALAVLSTPDVNAAARSSRFAADRDTAYQSGSIPLKQRSVRGSTMSRTGLREKVQLLESTVAALETQVATLLEYLEKMDTRFEERVLSCVAANDYATKSFVASQGYLTTESDPTVDASVKDGVTWSELSLIPAGFADGVDDGGAMTQADIEAMGFVTGPHTVDTKLSDADIMALGFIKTYTETDPTVQADVKDGVDWAELSGIPAGFADNTDDGGKITQADIEALGFVAGPHTLDTTLTPKQIGDFGFIKTYIETDPTVTLHVKNGVSWSELTGIPAGFADNVDDVGDGGGGSCILEDFVSIMWDELEGVNGPHILFTGANVHIRSGGYSTSDSGDLTGLGNLIIGYNEQPGDYQNFDPRKGSHNLVVGKEHEFPSYGGFLAGKNNRTNSPYASVSGGVDNTVNAHSSSICGGYENFVNSSYSVISGGLSNVASGSYSIVCGGIDNEASGYAASILGGSLNSATMSSTCVSGGVLNAATDSYASVSGGNTNTASGYSSSVTGGNLNTASALNSSVTGGARNAANGERSTVSGGWMREVNGDANWQGGGLFQNQ